MIGLVLGLAGLSACEPSTQEESDPAEKTGEQVEEEEEELEGEAQAQGREEGESPPDEATEGAAEPAEEAEAEAPMAAAADSDDSAGASRSRRRSRRMKKKDARRPTPKPTPKPVVPEGASEDFGVNPWVDPTEDKLSTFAVDVDTASYSIVRRGLESRRAPNPASVRVEEFVNYFDYDLPAPEGQVAPFGVSFEISPSPFDQKHTMMRVAVQGLLPSQVERKPAHLTFLVDTSGSMSSGDKLPLATKAMKMLINQLDERDTIAITTYAGSTETVLEATPATQTQEIFSAIDGLTSGGGTRMESGMLLAYSQARDSFEKGAINRVIVLSDGDANLGKTGYDEMLEQIRGYVDEGITMSTIGLGTGNYQDTRMEQLANKGNGNYYYIDSERQARRVFVEKIAGTLQVIAKDVKIQVEFDPERVEKYRLVGYENRDVADKDFRKDKVDAGEIGAGHAVTALYELELSESVAPGDPAAIVRLRHKEPTGTKAKETVWEPTEADWVSSFEAASPDHRFVVAVAAFAEVLRHSQAASDWTLSEIKDIAAGAVGQDPERQELVKLVETANQLEIKRDGPSKADVQRVLRGARSKVKECGKSSNYKGRATVSFKIELSGKPSGVAVREGQLKGQPIAKCLVDVVRGLQFPEHSGSPMAVSYPFMFR